MRHVLLIVMLQCIALTLAAQSSEDVSDSLVLKELTVSSLGIQKTIQETPYPVSLLNAVASQNIQINSPADLLKQAPGLSLMRDGIWATSVSLRGLSDQRIITLIDGNRLETATEIDGYLSMIDVNDIEKIEIIKSGASSLYGSGALGGVLNIITKKGKYVGHPTTKIRLNSGLHSVNNLFESGANMILSHQTYHVSLSGSYRTAGNTNTPEGILGNSGFNDYSFALKGGIRTFENQELNLNLQSFNGFDIGFPGGTAFPGPATVTFPDHKRHLASANYVMNDLSEHWIKSTINAYYQYILRDVNVDVVFPDVKTIHITPSGVHHTFGINFSNQLVFGKHNLFTGFDFFSRKAISTREKLVTNINGPIVLLGEKPLPDAQQSNVGIFLQDEFDLIEDKLDATIGIRGDLNYTSNDAAFDPMYKSVNGTLIDTPQRNTFSADEITTGSYGANAGLHFTPDNRNHLSLSLGRSFRAASIEEKFKYIDLGAKVRIGDPELKPEVALTGDIGYKFKSKIFSASMNGFYNIINEMIVEIPGTVTLPVNGGEEENITMDALIGSNVERAVLKGFDGEFTVFPVTNFRLYGNISYVLGTNETSGGYLPLMPPFNGSISATYNNKYVAPELRYNFTAAQNNIANGETKTEGYQTVDLTLNTSILKNEMFKVSLTAGVQNVLNAAYTNHLASNRGIIKLEPGRNFFVKLRIEL